MKKIKFQVDVKPMAKQSARFSARLTPGGKAITGSSMTAEQFRARATGSKPNKVHSYQTDDIKKYEQLVGFCAKMATKQQGGKLSGALGIKIRYYFEMPKSLEESLKDLIKRGKRVYKITKPDLDSNLNKPICDGMNGIVYDDDSRICKIDCEKLYGIQDHIIVEVYEMDVYYKSK